MTYVVAKQPSFNHRTFNLIHVIRAPHGTITYTDEYGFCRRTVYG